ncbi:MAG TPA: MBL fold metallo-hydrolase [Candidatus Polarisedimenticolaceae bacterium]|nr:MBL fold metallo-hydrolase [Candidatus Polarisedimenticolaceae bacterium]
MRIDTIDLQFEGTPQVIAAFLLRGAGGPVLIETGPGSTLATLHRGLAALGVTAGDVRHVLLTHIHLDHAGAAGWWARHGATVYVHPAGAPHLIDPSKLIRSAERIYGDRMESLWGEILPAPAERVVALADGATIEVEGLSISALATPGHAAHHHVFRIGSVAFTGDAAGIRLPGSEWIDLPAPPPEFDREAWRGSLDRLRQAGLTEIHRTHFGRCSTVAADLAAFEAVMERGTEAIRELLEQGVDRDEMVRRFGAQMRARARELGIDGRALRAYELANPRSMSVDGITRYWRKRAA